jgi:SAM-dependent methyltransferase
MNANCPFCGSDEIATTLTVNEMKVGSGEAFEYFQCGQCASLRISKSPEDLGKYYGNYGDRHAPVVPSRKKSPIKSLIHSLRDSGHFGGGWPIGGVLAKRKPDVKLRDMARAGIRRNLRILDVGCGKGALINRLAGIGFRNLLGVDQFAKSSFTTENGAKVSKQSLEEVTGEFDVVMFHHSLEHMPDVATVLRHVNKILAPKGICYVRIPTPSSEAFEVFGENWVQLDAPRHISLPSRDGMKKLAQATGFRVDDVIDDSLGFGIWGSELYRKGIHLNPGWRGEVKAQEHFDPKDLNEWFNRTVILNEKGRSDQVGFVLRKEA